MEKNRMAIIKNYIILVIVTVLSGFAIFLTYQEYILSSRLTLGQILCSQIRNAQLYYYQQNNSYVVTDKVFFSDELGIDARNNPYFYTFSTYSINNDTTQRVVVFGSDQMKDYEIYLDFRPTDKKTNNLKNLDIKVVKNKA